MRDVAVVSFSQSAVARDAEHNETEMLVPTVHAAIEESGIPKADIGFVCSGSLDYLQGGPFAFVSGLDSVGAWPPIRESHVEMDSAWALYESWVAHFDRVVLEDAGHFPAQEAPEAVNAALREHFDRRAA